MTCQMCQEQRTDGDELYCNQCMREFERLAQEDELRDAEIGLSLRDRMDFLAGQPDVIDW